MLQIIGSVVSISAGIRRPVSQRPASNLGKVDDTTGNQILESPGSVEAKVPVKVAVDLLLTMSVS